VNNSEIKKLPVITIFSLAFRTPIIYREALLKVLILPALLLIALDYLDTYYAHTLLKSLLVMIVYFFVYSYFAVSVHRIILLDERHKNIVIPRLSFRVLLYSVWLWGIVIVAGLIFLPWFLFHEMLLEKLESERLYQIFLYMGSLPCFFIIAKVSLILPAIALDRHPTWLWAWKASRHNNWQMFVIAGILPFLFGNLELLIPDDAPSLVTEIIFSALYLFLVIIEVSALSLSYKYLVLGKRELK